MTGPRARKSAQRDSNLSLAARWAALLPKPRRDDPNAFKFDPSELTPEGRRAWEFYDKKWQAFIATIRPGQAVATGCWEMPDEAQRLHDEIEERQTGEFREHATFRRKTACFGPKV